MFFLRLNWGTPQTDIQLQYFVLVITCAGCKGTLPSTRTLSLTWLQCLRMLLIPIASTISFYHTKASATICVPCALEMQLLPRLEEKRNRERDRLAFAGGASGQSSYMSTSCSPTHQRRLWHCLSQATRNHLQYAGDTLWFLMEKKWVS